MGSIQENIRKFREKRKLTQKALGDMVGKSESAVQGYESGKTDIPLSSLIDIAAALKVKPEELLTGKEKEPEKKPPMELLIFNQEDRLAVAQILIKNGYTVNQGKRRKTPTGKVLDYFIRVYGSGEDFEENTGGMAADE